jgi:hypothetical protein
MELRCPQCRTTLHLPQRHPYHAGFSNQGFLYCDTDSTIVTFGSYDRRYTALVGHVHPWMLDDGQRKAIEDHLVACPCGGRFLFAAEPRCPSCGASLRPALPGPGYYVILGRQLDGERDPIWKTA